MENLGPTIGKWLAYGCFAALWGVTIIAVLVADKMEAEKKRQQDQRLRSMATVKPSPSGLRQKLQ